MGNIVYDQPFINSYGDRYFFRGTIKLSDSKVVHAYGSQGRRVVGWQGWREVPNSMRYDICCSGAYWASRWRREINVDGEMHDVTCKKCLAIMKNTAINNDVAWEL